MRFGPAQLLVLLAFSLGGCQCERWQWRSGYDDLDPVPPPLPQQHECGDLDPSIDPEVATGTVSATEICNGVDDDCDGLVDQDDPDLEFAGSGWLDGDGDGYGDPASPVGWCEEPEDVVDNSDDCDDQSASAFPGGSEAWYDGVDGDCDGEPNPDPCEVPPPPEPVDADPSCEFTPASNWFNPVVEWILPTGPDGYHSLSTPMVGQLTDDDGDGDIDGDDMPDIVFVQTTASDPVLRVVSGDGLGTPWSLPALNTGTDLLWPSYQATVALGDIDGDGETEIVTTYEVKHPDGDYCGLGVQDGSGATEWFWGGDVTVECRAHAPALADLEGDGQVEVLFGNRAFRGSDGFLLWEQPGPQGYDVGYVNSGFHSFAVDLDNDGISEVLAGSMVLEANGAVRCVAGDDGYPAAADLDGDGDIEIVLTGATRVRIYDHQCILQRDWAVPDGGQGGPVTLADFDGDGLPELGLASETVYVVYEADGAVRWSRPVQDASSNSTGSAAFDFDGDGAAEAVYADEETLWVFDGATGAVLMEENLRVSGTRNEYPVVADVDSDGHAEIVVTNDGHDAVALFVVGEALDRWPNARGVWNQHAFHQATADEDGGIPRPAPAAWLQWNSFRQGHATSPPVDATSEPQPAADLEVSIVASCPQEQLVFMHDVTIQVVNRGNQPVALATVVATSYWGDLEFDLDTRQISLGPGAALTPYTVQVQLGTVPTDVRVVVDPAQEVDECDESNNIVELQVPPL